MKEKIREKFLIVYKRKKQMKIKLVEKKKQKC